MNKIIFLALALNLNITNCLFDKLPHGIRFCSKRSIYTLSGSTVLGLLSGVTGSSVLVKFLNISLGAKIGLGLAGAGVVGILGFCGSFGALFCYFYHKDRNNICLAIVDVDAGYKTNIAGIQRLLKEKPNILYEVDKLSCTPLERALCYSTTGMRDKDWPSAKLERWRVVNILIDADPTYKSVDRALLKYPEELNKAKFEIIKKNLHEKLNNNLPAVLINIILAYTLADLPSELEVVVEA